MKPTELALKRWKEEQKSFEAFALLAEELIRDRVWREGIWCQTSSRAKEPHSLVKKLLRGKHTYDALADKAGIRCVVRYRSDLERVISLAGELFDCAKTERKEDGLGDQKVGYTSVHIDIRLRHGGPGADAFPASRYQAELQIRTLGQHLWSEMSHDSVYKNDETLAALPPDVRRRVNLMAGMIEVADREFDRLNAEMTMPPTVQVLRFLEQRYFGLSAKQPDLELSLQIVDLLLPLYEAEPRQVIALLDAFITARYSVLEHVYASPPEASDAALLFQPEALMLYERLEVDQLATREAWNERYAPEELEKVANVFGISFD